MTEENEIEQTEEVVGSDSEGMLDHSTAPGDASPLSEAEAAYEANYGYQIKGEEHTFDERLHPIIKDKDTEDFLRDTFTRSMGLDRVKDRLTESQKKYSDLETQYNTSNTENQNFRGSLERLNELKDSDPMGFQKQWGLNDQWVLDRATQILEHSDNPQQAQMALQASQDREQAFQNEQNFSRENARSQTMERELHSMKMNQALTAGEVGEFARSYDTRMGEGAFKAQVDDFGSLQYHQTQRYVDPQVAVSEVYGKLKNLFGEPAPQSLSPTGSNQPQTAIPNMGQGISGTPTTKRFNTLKELRAHAESMSGY